MTLIHVQTFPTLLTLKLNFGFRFVGLGINLKYQCDHCDTIKISSYCDISNKVWHYWVLTKMWQYLQTLTVPRNCDIVRKRDIIAKRDYHSYCDIFCCKCDIIGQLWHFYETMTSLSNCDMGNCDVFNYDIILQTVTFLA